MPCNLSVSIAAGKVANEQLLALVDDDLLALLVDAFAAERSTPVFWSRTPAEGRCQFSLGDTTYTITEGRITARGNRWNAARTQETVDALVALLSASALEVLAARASVVLQNLGIVQTERTEVDNEGQRQPAILLRVSF